MARALPRNDEVADQLDLLADMLEIEGEAGFRVRAYRRAATRVRDTAAPIAELALQGQAKALQGIGKTIEEKIVEVVEGSPAAVAGLRAEDLIVELNGIAVAGVDDLQRLMAGELIGQSVTLETVRDGKRSKIELVPVELEV